jgi:hypothetical protein
LNTQVFLWRKDINDYNWGSYNPSKFDRVSSGQFRQIVDEMKTIPNYDLKKLDVGVTRIRCLNILLFLGINGLTVWLMITYHHSNYWWAFLTLPFCALLLMIVIFIASAYKRSVKFEARSIAIENLLVELNAKCFSPARYCLQSSTFNSWFLLTNLDLAPENLVNIVPVGPVMGGYPGIPSGYAPGQPQPVGQWQPMFLGQPAMPAQNFQPYMPPPNPNMPHEKSDIPDATEGPNFEYPNDGPSMNKL